MIVAQQAFDVLAGMGEADDDHGGGLNNKGDRHAPAAHQCAEAGAQVVSRRSDPGIVGERPELAGDPIRKAPRYVGRRGTGDVSIELASMEK